ncbi:sigma-70 family RNA polymerase sigma factor [Kitasatospora arboriphila]|uniref:Glycosyl hydrolase family 98 putative carbohydrate-binding module domain-containing protein n=1 Tax=Kitasatospora arboriphila TaxID=258052 RepID=A0ABN1U6C8_9ACTN
MSAEELGEPGSGAGPSGQVPDQAGAPLRESLAGRVPGQAAAGLGGVTPEAFIGEEPPARAVVPAPADPVDGERPPSDAELTARVRAGDDSAYEEVYRRHAEAVRRYARTCCRDSFTAEDLAGEVFARTLQALKAGRGPEFAVRAYLLTAVRNVAAAWARTERREQLVDDFGSFAQGTAGAAIEYDLADPGADAWAMALADQRMVMRAYAGLPEDDRVVLWHTEVERESPKAVAVMLGKTANATAVQAHRARDRLAAAFLQAHVSGSQEQGCAAYANRLGAYARGSLRKRASAEVGRHVQGCARCTAACVELTDINHSLRAVLPGGVLLWVGTGAFAKAAAAGAVLGGAAVAGAVGAAGAATSGGTAVSGAAAAGGASAGGSGGAIGAAAGEGLGVAAKAGIAASVALAAAAVAAWALSGPADVPPEAAPRAAVVSSAHPPVVESPLPVPSESPSPVVPPAPPRRSPLAAPVVPSPAGSATEEPPSPVRTQEPSTPAPEPPSPDPTPVPTPTPTATPAPPPTAFWLDDLPFAGSGRRDAEDEGRPAIRRGGGSLARRPGLWMAGQWYRHALSVHVPSRVVVDLNRSCTAFDAVVGPDDLAVGRGSVVFAVLGEDGSVLWRSGPVRAGDRPVRVHAPLAGQRSIRLVAERADGGWALLDVADWADARLTC